MSKMVCKYNFQNSEKFNGEPYCCLFNEKCKDLSFVCDKNCQVYEDYKQLEELKAENLGLKILHESDKDLLKRKEQECKKKSWEIGNLGYKIKNQRKEINIRLEQLDQLKAKNKELKEELEELKEENEYNEANAIEFKQTLTEIKEIAKPYQRDIHKICGYCRKYDSCHACCIDDLKLYEYRTGTTKACERFVELERFNINIVANLILQKISEVEDEQE